MVQIDVYNLLQWTSIHLDLNLTGKLVARLENGWVRLKYTKDMQLLVLTQGAKWSHVNFFLLKLSYHHRWLISWTNKNYSYLMLNRNWQKISFAIVFKNIINQSVCELAVISKCLEAAKEKVYSLLLHMMSAFKRSFHWPALSEG